ncbi:thioredoxin family protein [Apibacter muscae]|nr:thioredoxin family protein [Apibacter muscae]
MAKPIPKNYNSIKVMAQTIDLKYYWEQAVSYDSYKEIIEKQAQEGINNEEDKDIQKLAEYTRLNLSRIHRNDKTLVLEESVLSILNKLNKKVNILAISEGWCGDASQIVPVVQKLAESSSNIDFKLFFRDADEKLIQQYLTNGGKAIPIILFIDAETFEEMAHWGPRPQSCAPFLKKYKENPETYTHDDFAKDIQGFYNKDKGHEIANELTQIISKI